MRGHACRQSGKGGGAGQLKKQGGATAPVHHLYLHNSSADADAIIVIFACGCALCFGPIFMKKQHSTYTILLMQT